VSVPCFLPFLCFKKATQEIFSKLDETKAKVPIFPTRDGFQSRDGGEPGARHDPAPGRATRGCGHLAHLLTPPLRLYILLDEKNPKGRSFFSRNISRVVVIVDLRLRGSRSSSRHPAGKGNHHRRPSSSPCMPLE
jgi:hypothetical protein